MSRAFVRDRVEDFWIWTFRDIAIHESYCDTLGLPYIFSKIFTYVFLNVPLGLLCPVPPPSTLERYVMICERFRNFKEEEKKIACCYMSSENKYKWRKCGKEINYGAPRDEPGANSRFRKRPIYSRASPCDCEPDQRQWSSVSHEWQWRLKGQAFSLLSFGCSPKADVSRDVNDVYVRNGS